MLDLAKHRILKYFLFADLYFSEGLQFAIASVIIILLFNDKNIPIETTTFISGVAASPWILKFVFGPTIDFFNKHGRKFFVISGGLIGGFSCMLVAFVDPTHYLLPFTVLIFLGHLGVVVIDVAADAWAIQVTTERDRGKINGAMTAGLFGGSAFGSVLFTTIATYYGFSATFLTCGVIILLSIILPLLVTEIKIEIERKKIVNIVIKEFKKKNTQIIALFGFFIAFSFGLLMFVMPDYMTNVLNLDKIQTGIVTSVYQLMLVTGAIIGGIISDRFGRKRPMAVFLMGLLISIAFLVTSRDLFVFIPLYGTIGFFMGGATFTMLFSLYMDNTNPKVCATQYSFLTSIANFGEIGIATVSGLILATFGYNRFFLFTALSVGVTLLILYFVYEKKWN